MPRHTRNEIKAGALIIFAVGLLIVGIIIIADFETILRPDRTYHFSFARVEGLRVGDDVLYAGIKGGKVTHIEFTTLEDQGAVGDMRTRVLVTVEMDADVPIMTNDKPTISRGFTGSVFMDIVPFKRYIAGQVTGTPLETTPEKPLEGYHYPTLKELSEQAQGFLRRAQDEIEKLDERMQVFTDDLKEITTDVKDVTGRVQKAVAGNEERFETMFANAEKTVRHAEETMREVKPRAISTVDAAQQTIAETRKKIEEMLPKMQEIVDKLNEAATEVRTASGNVSTASADVRTSAAEAREIIVANRPNIDGTIDEMRQAAARINLGMEDIRRNPWKLLSRNIEADAYTQNIYDATMSFAAGARALSQASANLEASMSRQPRDPEAIKESTEKINRLVDEMTKLEQLLFEAMKQRPK